MKRLLILIFVFLSAQLNLSAQVSLDVGNKAQQKLEGKGYVLPGPGTRYEFHITVVREFSDSNGTYGHLEVNGNEVAKTAERNDKLTALPQGVPINVSLLFDDGRGHVMNEWSDGPTQKGDFLLQFNTPGHEALQIHNGNVPAEESDGCILIGTRFQSFTSKKTGKSYPVAVLNSWAALRTLRSVFYKGKHPVSSTGSYITIEFVNTPEFQKIQDALAAAWKAADQAAAAKKKLVDQAAAAKKVATPPKTMASRSMDRVGNAQGREGIGRGDSYKGESGAGSNAGPVEKNVEKTVEKAEADKNGDGPPSRLP